MTRIAIIAAFTARLLMADVRQCACDPATPETLTARECSLCNEADRHTGDGDIFFLKDNNPRKPNRWLALPRTHAAGSHPLHALPQQIQIKLWTEAIAKAQDLWGPTDWGIAYNGEINRTQCHGHVHIGKLLKGLAPGKYKDVSGPAAIRLIKDGSGVWIHPIPGGKLRVHFGEGITETVLLR